MLNLLSTTDSIQLVTTGATVQIATFASYTTRDYSNGRTILGNTPKNIVAAATDTLVAAPGANMERNVQTLEVRNTHATVTTPITLNWVGSLTIELWKGSLAPGDFIMLLETGQIAVTTAGAPRDVQSFIAAGAITWNKPTAFTPQFVVVSMWGAGGGGGAGGSTTGSVSWNGRT